MSETETYSKLLRARTAAKQVQQTSWNMAQIEKKFDIEKIEPFEYETLLNVYLDFRSQLQAALTELNNIAEDVETTNTH